MTGAKGWSCPGTDKAFRGTENVLKDKPGTNCLRLQNLHFAAATLSPNNDASAFRRVASRYPALSL